MEEGGEKEEGGLRGRMKVAGKEGDDLICSVYDFSKAVTSKWVRLSNVKNGVTAIAFMKHFSLGNIANSLYINSCQHLNCLTYVVHSHMVFPLQPTLFVAYDSCDREISASIPEISPASTPQY